MFRPLALAAALALTALVSAQEPKPEAKAEVKSDAKAIVTKAIAAHGGEAALAKYKAGSSKLKGTFALDGKDIDFTGDLLYQAPDKFRMNLNADVMGQKIAIVQVVNGEKELKTVNGAKTPSSDAEKAEAKQALVMQEMVLLTPLLAAGGKYKLEALPGEKVGEQEVDVVQVSREKAKTVKLYFDKKTGLLVKTSRKALPPGAVDNKEVTEETVMSEFQKVADILLPTKTVVTHDGKKFMTMTATETKVLSTVDGKPFAVDD